MSDQSTGWRLQRPAISGRDHVRGGAPGGGVTVILYGDYLCPYCRRLRHVLRELRQAMGERLAYVFRHFPDERAHPGAELASRAVEAASLQGRFWPMHDALYEREPPLAREDIFDIARSIGLDMERFAIDLERDEVRLRVAEDLEDGKRTGVAGTPTIFVDGTRYDGAWDFYSMLEALQRPLGARVRRAAQAFANLPASAGFLLLIAAAAAIICANSPIAPLYHRFIGAEVGIAAPGGGLALTLGEWTSEGLLTFFFLLVGLEIRREMSTGALTDRRAALLPVLAAIGGVLAPAAIFLAINSGPARAGWAIPTATDVAFTLGILALLGRRAPAALVVFVAALAVIDDILSMLTLAIFYPRAFDPAWLIVSAATVTAMFALNRWRVYAGWPYLLLTIGLWVSLHGAGVHAALAGVVLAALIPTRPTANAGALLAQAATALAALEDTEKDSAFAAAGRTQWQPVWNWARLNLAAASERLLSPAERVEQALAPWSSYVVLPLFAFAATGVSLNVDVADPTAVRVTIGVILGLVIGKPLGIGLVSWLAVKTKIAVLPDVPLRAFVGAACLCGVGDTVAILLADQAFPDLPYAQSAKVAVLAGSVIAAVLGAIVIAAGRKAPRAPTHL